ncbi:arginine--tRNA ligase [Pseudactinotalea sp. HY158]|uniref:arginine--tRNA ligase n=1 Tax=Pseudactinotalea sp. HY158 TaxID=2654547 RepID=UPI00129C37C5|nr:arginine--tRNA ligase [Pseudactinotalea sp. HY158]QGH68127.1 arginine--tRNA ligase [Pseudactinotalea sp. HY158]
MTSSVPSLAQRLDDTLARAIAAAYPEQAGADPLVRPSDHADLQANAALALAKKVGANPRQVATRIVEELGRAGLIGSVEISGPGFLNLTLSDAALWDQVRERLDDDRLGVPASRAGTRTVVDYSGPNIAKEMHVGHLRSSIIGDSIARILGFLGSDVVRQNHLGDWGTQFGMLIQFIDENPDVAWRAEELSDTSPVSALDGLYKRARARFDADEDFADRARARVVALQAGDPATLATWREIVDQSQRFFSEVYGRLGLQLTPADAAGESFYNPMLPVVAAELADAGVAVESDGALVFLSEEVTGPDDKPAALMVRKSDGGYGYDTTDLATLRYRVRDLGADRILYVVGAPQALHFRLVFEAATKAGWLHDGVGAAHVPFGSVLGADGKPFKTRAGVSAKLMDLLSAAVDAARAVVREAAEEKGADPDDPALDLIAEQAGIAAIKYADLSSNRIKDYTFDPERMVSFHGNTGVYLQYAHTRLASILRKAAERGLEVEASAAVHALSEPLESAERALALQLDQFGAAVETVAGTLEPHTLCTYAYELARTFTEFYDQCPVLASSGAVRERRLLLVDLTRRTLARALDLLGIAAPERM